MNAFVYCTGEKIEFEVPPGWSVLYGQEIKPAKLCPDPRKELKRSLDHPIGSPKLEELARRASRAVVVFDDLTRPTPTHLAFPEVLHRLNRGGIIDERITAVCATGTHQAPDVAGLRKKMGDEAYDRLYPRVYNHDAESRENVLLARTSRGTPVEVNPHVAGADLAIGIGSCFPHNWAGFGGGSKIVMPGICGFQSIALHHLTWIRNPNTHTGVTKGNLFYDECNEIARLINFQYKIDFLLNPLGEVIKIFSGDIVREHEEASKECVRVAAVDVPRKADVTISAAYPLERGNQSIKSLTAAASVTKGGGQVIWVAPQPDRDQLLPLVNELRLGKTANLYHRELMEGKYPEPLKPMGLSFMCTVLEIIRYRDEFSRVIHVTEGLDRSDVEAMKMVPARTIEEACEMAEADLPRGDLIVFPYGGVVMPRIAHSPQRKFRQGTKAKPKKAPGKHRR